MSKLREIYDKFKADGAPLPDTFDEFHDYMCAPGVQGVKNRQEWYDKFKADGAPLPDTYDEFSKAVFFPVDNKSNKKDSFSSADASARGLAGTQSPTGQETTSDKPATQSTGDDSSVNTEASNPAGDVRKPYRMSVKERIASQYKMSQGLADTNAKMQGNLDNVARMRKFDPLTKEGRDNRKAAEVTARAAGGYVKPLGITAAASSSAKASAQNKDGEEAIGGDMLRFASPVPYGVKMVDGVQRTEWLMPDGSLTTDFSEADRAEYGARQARLQQTRNTTVSEKLRKALEEQKRLDELMRKRVKEIDEENRTHPVQNFLRGMADEGQGIPGGLVNDNGMRDYRMDKQYRQLESASRKNRQAIQTLSDIKNKKTDNFWHSMGTSFADGYTLTDGLSDLNDAIALLDAQKNIKNINLKSFNGEKLTDEEMAAEAVLRSSMENDAIQGEYGGEYGSWAKAGSMFAKSLDLMKDIMLTPGAGTIAKGIASGVSKGLGTAVKTAAKVGGKNFSDKVAESVATKFFTKSTGILVGAHAAGAVVSNTSGIGHTMAEVGKGLAGDVSTNIFGGYDIKNSKDILEALFDAEKNQIRENGSEMFGEFIPGIGGFVTKGLEKIGLKRVSNYLTSIGKKDWYKQYSSLLESGGYNGLPGEALEEYEGYLFDILTGNGKEALDEISNLDTHIDIWLGCATTGALLGSVPMAIHGGHTAMYYKYKHNANKSDLRGAAVVGERWGDLRDEIDSSPNESLSITVANILKNNNLDFKSNVAVLDYARNIAKMRGHNLAQISSADDEKSSDEIEQVESSYMDGYNISETAEMQDARIRFERMRGRLVGSIGEDDVVKKFDGEDAVSNLRNIFDDELRQEAIDYVNARNVYRGMIDAVRDDIDSRIAVSNAEVDARTHKQTGRIQSATITGGKEGEGRKVDIIDGNIALSSDGQGINISESDESIIVRDQESGELEFVSSSMFLSMDEDLDAEEVKATAAEAIRQQIAQEASAKIDGTLSFAPGEIITILDDYGNPAEFTVSGDAVDENGQPIENHIEVRFTDEDGAERSAIYPKETLQEWTDEYAQSRVDTFEQEQEAEREDETSASPQHRTGEENTSDKPAAPGTSAEFGNNGEEIIPEIGNNGEENIPSPDSALGRIAKDENGNPDYLNSEPDLAWDALMEQTEGDEEIARQIISEEKKSSEDVLSAAESVVKEIEKEIRDASKVTPQLPDNYKELSVAERIAAQRKAKEQINAAVAEIQNQLDEAKAEVEKARKAVEHWDNIGMTPAVRAEAEAKAQREAEEARIAAEKEAEREWKEAKRKMDKRLRDAAEEMRDCPEAIEILKDMTPQNIYEVAALVLSGSKILLKDDGVKKGYREMTGSGKGESRNMFGMFASAEKGGKSLESLAEDTMKEICDEYGILYDNGEAVSALLDVLQSCRSRGEINAYIANNRLNQARQAYDRYMSEMNMTPEEEAQYEEYLQNEYFLNNYGITKSEHDVYIEVLEEDAKNHLENFDENEYYGNIADEYADREARIAAQKEAESNINQENRNGTERKDESDTEGVQRRIAETQGQDTAGEGSIYGGGNEILSSEDAGNGRGGETDEGGQGVQQEIGVRGSGSEIPVSAEASGRGITYKLSDEVNEYGKPFVKSSDGTIDFGRIDEESDLDPLPIRLSLGENQKDENGNNHGYGYLHIEAGHKEQILQNGFSSIEEFVESVAKNYTDIREGAKIGGNQTYLLEVSDEHNNTLFIQLSRDGKYWNVNSAGIFKKKYSRSKPKVYSKPALGTGTAPNTSEVNSGNINDATAPAGNSSETSGRKVNDSASEKQGNEGESSSNYDVNTNPTPAQRDAGNYKKGHVVIEGMRISIENPAGSIRRGVDADGTPWETEMKADYGYIRGTQGKDKDHIDIYLSSVATDEAWLDEWDMKSVYIIDQYNKDGSFDEHKVVYGVVDDIQAKLLYLENYDSEWAKGRRIEVTEVSLEEFKKWAFDGHRKVKPYAELARVKDKEDSSPAYKPADAVVKSEVDELCEKAIQFIKEYDSIDVVEEFNRKEAEWQKLIVDLEPLSKMIEECNSIEEVESVENGLRRAFEKDVENDSAENRGERDIEAEFWMLLSRIDPILKIDKKIRDLEEERKQQEKIDDTKEIEVEGARNGKVKLAKIPSKEDKITGLSGVFHDGNAKVAVASDGKVLVVSSKDYDSANKGKVVIDGKGEDLGYPAYEKILPGSDKPLAKVKVNFGTIGAKAAQHLNATKEAAKAEAVSQKYIISRSAVVLDIPGEGYAIVPVESLLKFADAARYIGAKELEFNERGILVARNGKDIAMCMPTGFNPEGYYGKITLDGAARKHKGLTGEESGTNGMVYEMTKGLVESAGVPVVEVSDEEAQAMLGNKNTHMQFDLGITAKDALKRAEAIRSISPVEVSSNDMTKEELSIVYSNLPIVEKDGHKIVFYNSAFKKIYKEGGIFGQIVPELDKVLRSSVLAFSEPDNLGGTVRPDGTVHKAHPNVNAFDHYVGKANINGEDYYVRFTVQRQKLESGTHSFFVTEVKVYEKSADSLSEPNFPSGESDRQRIVDAKLQQFFDIASSEAEKDGKPRFSIQTYHGTSADFDAFDFSYMGSGEGAQAYGWGGYVTSIEGIGKSYADDMAGKAFKNGVFRSLAMVNVRKPLDKGERFEDVKSMFLEKMQRMYERSVERSSSTGELKSFKEDYERFTSMTEDEFRDRRLYTVEIPDDTGRNYLSWEDLVPTDFAERLKEVMTEKEHREYEKKLAFLHKSTDYDYDIAEYQIYAMGKFLEQDRISQILSEMGYVGIKYPADSMRGGRADNAQNYVIFREEDMKITNKVKFLKTPEGKVYGWTIGGKVYLNRDAMNPETPVHEYTHLWDDMVREENPELWERGKELMKQTPLWDEVKNDPAYVDIRDDEDAIASEVHSRLTGKKGAERVEQMMKDAAEEPDFMKKVEKIDFVHRLKAWLSDMFKELKKTLSKWSKQDLSDLSMDDFVDLTLRDLAEGLNPQTEQRRGRQTRAVTQANPMLDDYHTGIREREDVKTFDEMLSEAEAAGETMYPDMSLETLREAKETGKIAIYSSKPIEEGGFVTPSRMNAEDYAGGGKVYEKEVPIDDVAWIDDSEGQYAPLGRDNGKRIGEKDVARLHFSGVRATYGIDNRFDKLEEARKMERELGKEKSRAIKWATGWERGADGRWRYEQKDYVPKDAFDAVEPIRKSEKALEAEIEKALDKVHTLKKELGNTPIYTDEEFEQWIEYVDARGNDEGFIDSIYPEVEQKEAYMDRMRRREDLKIAIGEAEEAEENAQRDLHELRVRNAKEYGKMEVSLSDLLGSENALFAEYPELSDVRVVYDPFMNIRGSWSQSKRELKLNPNAGSKQMRYTLVHEIQHAIQNIEGFTTGTSKKNYREPDELEKTHARVQSKLKATFGKDADKVAVRIAKGEDVEGAGLSFVETESLRKLYKLSGNVVSFIGDHHYYAEVGARTPEDMYWRNSGEVEARNAARRLDMTDDWRRLPATETEDVSRDRQHTDHGYAGLFDFSESAAMSREKEDFDAKRERAVRERGIVTPGLADMEVRVVEVPRHDFAGGHPIAKARKWARENIVGEHTATDSDGVEFGYTISGRSIDKYLSTSAVGKSDNLGAHLSVLKKLPEVISESIEVEIHPDYNKGEDGVRRPESGYNEDNLIHRFYGEAEIEGGLYRIKTTVVENGVRQKNKPHSYEVTNVELIDEAEVQPDNHGRVKRPRFSEIGKLEPTATGFQDQLPHGTAKLLKGVEKSYDAGVKLLEASEKRSHERTGVSDRVQFAKEPSTLFGGSRWIQKSLFDMEDETSASPQHRTGEGFTSDKPADAEEKNQNSTGLAEEANMAIDEYSERFAQKYSEYMELSGEAAERGDNSKDAILERLESELIGLSQRLESQLEDYYESEGNSEGEARKMARDMVNTVRAEVTTRVARGQNSLASLGTQSSKTRDVRTDNSGNNYNFASSYKTEDGKEIKYTSQNPEGYKALSDTDTGGEAKGGTDVDDDAGAGNIQRGDNPILTNTVSRLDTENGEFSLVERVFTETGSFGFTSGERIESADDVAFIFSSLEDAAKEHSFIVLVKDGEPTVVELGMGGLAGCPIDLPTISLAYSRIQPDEMYFVHNHPSGNLVCSPEDERMLKRIEGMSDVPVHGIIINLKTGRYGTFGKVEGFKVWEEKAHPTMELPLKVYTLDKQIFAPDYNPMDQPQIRQSKDVAEFLNSHRMGDRAKISFLILARTNRIIGNIHTPFTSIPEDPAELARYISERVIQFGGENVILYGDFYTDDYFERVAFSKLKKEVANVGGGLRLLDIMKIEGNNTRSMADEGILNEPSEDYGGAGEDQVNEHEGLELLNSQQRKELNVALSKRPTRPIHVIGKGTDLKGLFLPDELALELEYLQKDEDTMGCYNQYDGKIYIFADKIRNGRIEELLLHENVHAVVDEQGSECRAFLDIFAKSISMLPQQDGVYGKLYSALKEDVEEDQIGEEMLAYSLQWTLRDARSIKWIESALDNDSLNYLHKILEKLDGNREKENEVSDLLGQRKNRGYIPASEREGWREYGEEEVILTRPVEDAGLIAQLDAEPKVKAYRMLAKIDGNYYSPMSTKVEGKLRNPIPVGSWEETEERPDLAVEKEGEFFFVLQKDNGTSISARYNPYIHASRIPVNDQFSSAWKRENLVTVEVEIPESELTSEYKAEKAKDSTGEMDWKSGPVGGKLAKAGKPRKVILSRYDKVVREVPVEEVAKEWALLLDGTGIEVPFNTVTPELRDALEAVGVKIGKPQKGNAGKASRPAYEEWLGNSVMERQGTGAKTDAEVSYENDPWAKVFGESHRTLRKQKEYAERERKRMRKAIENLEKRLGVKINVIENAENITSDKPAAPGTFDKPSDAERKRKAKGWYDKRTKEIFLVLGNHVSAEDVELTILHEAVAHYGLRKMIGEDRFNEFLDKCWDAANEEVKDAISYLASKNGWNKRTAIEEYLAILAESIDYENDSKAPTGWFRKIKEFFVDLLNSVGFKYVANDSLSQREFGYILWRSYQNLIGRDRGFLWDAENVVMQEKMGVGNYAPSRMEVLKASESTITDAINERFNEELQSYLSGNLSKQAILHLGNPKKVMTAFLPDKPIVIRQRILRKASETKHNVGIESLRNLPSMISEPIFVFQRDNETIGILTEIKDRNGKNVCVAIELDKAIQNGNEILEVNDIRSIHGREAENIILPILNNNTLRYVDKEKGLAWLSSASYNYQQEIAKQDPESSSSLESSQKTTEWLSSAKSNSQAIANQDLDNVANIVKSFENPTIEEEESLMFRAGNSYSSARDEYDERVKTKRKKRPEDKAANKTTNRAAQLNEAYLDSMRSLKVLQEAISHETGKPIEDYQNAYINENAMSSRNKAQEEIYKRDFFKPMCDVIAEVLSKNIHNYRELLDYVIAKHGLERNVHMRAKSIANGMEAKYADKTDYAGLTALMNERDVRVAEVEAQKMVDEFERKYQPQDPNEPSVIQKMWDKVNACTGQTLRRRFESGLLSKDMYDQIRMQYSYYIPLKGWEDTVAADIYEYSASGYGLQSALMTAYGRKSVADDPFATIMTDAQRTIMEANRNEMKQRFLNLATDQRTSLLSVGKQWYVKQYDGTWVPDSPIIPEYASPEAVDAIVKQHEADMLALQAKGKARTRRAKLTLGLNSKSADKSQHLVEVKRNGETYCIYVCGDPRAARAMNGMLNPDANEDGNVKKAAQEVKNFIGRTLTSWNPEFVVGNLSRDIMFAGTAVAVKEDRKYTSAYTKNVTNILFAAKLPRLLYKWENGQLNDKVEVERLFKEFIENGGETGFTQLNTVEKTKKEMARFLKEAKGGASSVPKKAWRSFWNGVEFMNRSAEDTTRFAVYMTSRQQGRTIGRSIWDAKEITVNFNKKGSGALGAKWMNFAYIFFNACMQAAANAGRIIKAHPVKSGIAGASFMASGILIPVINIAAMALTGGGDDGDDYWNLPEWVRRNNVCIYIPWTHKFLTIPIAHELRPFYGAGEIAFSIMMSKETVEDGIIKGVEGLSGLLPVDYTGNGGDAIVNFTPTVFQPAVQIFRNTDYFGKPIYKKTPWNENDPEWTKAYKSTSPFLVDLTRMLSEAGATTDEYDVKEYPKHFWSGDINPAWVEHLFESYFGGLGKTVNGTGKVISMLWDEDMRELRNVPVLRKFMTNADDKSIERKVSNDYFKYKEEYEKGRDYLKELVRLDADSIFDKADRVDRWIETDAGKRFQLLDAYIKGIEKRQRLLKKSNNDSISDVLTRDIDRGKRNLIQKMDSLNAALSDSDEVATPDKEGKRS